MNSKKVKISEVKLNPSNPRKISEDKLSRLTKSIQEFPKMLELRPIVVDDNMIVLGGNMRLQACINAGLKEIHIVKATDLTPEEQQQFIIKDNVNYGDWDWDVLMEEWNDDELQEWGLDVPVFDDFIKEPTFDDDTRSKALDSYINNTIKQITLFYTSEDYPKILDAMKKIAGEKGLDDNSEVVEHLLRTYFDKK